MIDIRKRFNPARSMLVHSLWLAPLAQAALWPLAHMLLLAPQRRPPDPDQNRPL